MTDSSITTSRTVLTGANGFLGWHTRAALQEKAEDVSAIPVGERFDLSQARHAVNGADRAIHIAGVNRASSNEIGDGNLLFAQQLAETLITADRPPSIVVFANSTQAGNGSVYGESKIRAAEILAKAAQQIGAEFRDIRLPNLFGEHGRPFYNAVTSTFCQILVDGGEPTVDNDKELTLLHAQDAADLLIGNVAPDEQMNLEQQETVSGLLSRLKVMNEVYAAGEIADISTKFQRDLFNTYRSYKIDARPSLELVKHADPRGSFTEIIRTHGGTGQSSFSTTVPGVLRGGHYHRRKVERFLVLAGEARISMRKLFTNKTIHFDVNGNEPIAIDMPTMWTHSIENTGSELLVTHFWTDDHFNPTNPDTIMEDV